MNYQKIYDQIIQKARFENRVKGQGTYYERHHIIPKCLGGSDKKENLVLLTAREHFICHQLLFKVHPNNTKLAYAFWGMCNLKDKNQERYKPSSRTYQEAKELVTRLYKAREITQEFRDKMSKVMKGVTLGRKHTEEAKRKIREGRSKNPPVITEELRKRLSESGKRKIFTEEHRQNLSKACKLIKRLPISEETKKRMRESHRNRKLEKLRAA